MNAIIDHYFLPTADIDTNREVKLDTDWLCQRISCMAWDAAHGFVGENHLPKVVSIIRKHEVRDEQGRILDKVWPWLPWVPAQLQMVTVADLATPWLPLLSIPLCDWMNIRQSLLDCLIGASRFLLLLGVGRKMALTMLNVY
jgi:hypothetical protein